MSNYLDYMQAISSKKASSSKLQYFKYNFARFFKERASVLEIGPGLGEFIEFAFEHNPSEVDIVDRDNSTLESLKSRFKVRQALEFSAEDFPKFRNKLSKYDLIFMMQVMEHVQTDALVPLIESLYDCLNQGGHLLITVPNGANPFGIVERYSDITHHNLFTKNSLMQLCKFAGIKDNEVAVQGYRIPAFGLVNRIRIVLQSVLHSLQKIALIINGGVHFSPMHPNITLIVTKRA